MKFDVIIGNPPYQLGKNRQFYKQFVIKSLGLSKGITAMITPSGWASFSAGRSSFLNLLKDNGLCVYKYLGDSAFDIQLLTVYFICDNNNNTGSVRVIAKEDSGDLPTNLITFLPSKNINSLYAINVFTKAAELNGGYTAIKGSLNRNRVITADSNSGVKCIFGCGRKGEGFDWKYIDNAHLVAGDVVGNGVHKVIVSRVTSVGKLGELKYAGPEYVCSQSVYYIAVTDEKEATEVIQWLSCESVKKVVKEMKATVCSNSQAIFAAIPRNHTTGDRLH